MNKKTRKKNLAGMAAIMLIFSFVVACPNPTSNSPSNSSGGIVDDPVKGTMTKATADRVFEYEEIEGGVTINKFISAPELQSYLAAGVYSRATVAHGHERFVIGKINGVAVTEIGSGAFSPEHGAASLTDAGATEVRLPETLEEISGDTFAGTSGLTLLIPDLTLETLRGNCSEALDAISNDLTIEAVAGLVTKLQILEVFGEFDGEKTIDELFADVGKPPYAEGKWDEGWAAYSDIQLTREINGATRVTKETYLYFSETERQEAIFNGELTFEDAYDLRDHTHLTIFGTTYTYDDVGYPAFPIGKWVDSGYGYFEFYANGKAKEYHPNYGVDLDGDGQGNGMTTEYEWRKSGSGNYRTLIFTHETFCATEQQIAFVNNWKLNPAAAKADFIAARDWIPATSTVNPEITKYNFSFNVVDHPVMTPFVNDTNLVGTWTSVAQVQNIDSFTSGTTGTYLYWAGVKFDATSGTVQQRNAVDYDNAGAGTRFTAWRPMGSWTKINTTIEGVVSHGIINSYALAPEYTIKTISSINYLFVQYKDGFSYGNYAEKPGYYVFTKVVEP